MKLPFLVASAIVLGSALPARAASDAEYAKVLLAYGSGMAKAIAASNQSPPSPPKGLSDAGPKAVAEFSKNYTDTKNKLEGTALAFRTTAQFAVDGGAAVLTASGVGAVPAMAVRALGQMAVDGVMDDVDAQARAGVQTFLVDYKDKIVSTLGADWQDLSAEEIGARIGQIDEVSAGITSMFPDDDRARSMTRDLSGAVIKELGLEAITRTEKNGDDIRKMAKALDAFDKQTTTMLGKQEQTLDELSEASGEMQASINTISQKLDSQAAVQGTIMDFVFREMEPAAKADAIRGGYIPAQLMKCKPEAPDCSPDVIKDALISRFEAEAKIKAAVTDAKDTASALSDIATIADNLGLGGDFASAARYGEGAFNAFASAASGNYLGAIVTVTGMFGSRRDPEQERFAALMGYLQQQFEVINQKLDTIIQNQKQIYDAVQKVSLQIEEMNQSLNERLDNVDFNLRLLTYAVGVQGWSEWSKCQGVYAFVMTNPAFASYSDMSDFESFGQMQEVISAEDLAIKDCVATAQSKPLNLLDSNWFGNFLDARQAPNFMPDVQPPDKPETKYWSKETLRSYIEDTFTPLLSLVEAERVREGLAPGQLAALLALPSPTIADYAPRLVAAKAASNPCTDVPYASEGIGLRIICNSAVNHDAAAQGLLTTPMVFDGALSITNWLLLISRFAEIRDPITGNFLNEEQILTGTSRSKAGRTIVENCTLIIDAAVVGNALLYSDFTASAFLHALEAPVAEGQDAELARQDAREKALALLSKNAILANNVARLALRVRYERLSDLPAIANSEDFYYGLLPRSADPIARQTSADLLKRVFGNDLSFEYDEADGQMKVRLDSIGPPIGNGDDLTVSVALPTSRQFATGELSWSQQMQSLIHMRDVLTERLLDYRVSAAMTAETAAPLGAAIARASFKKAE